MSSPVRINDAADLRLSDYLALTDVDLRKVKEVAAGLFMAEGEKVIRRALAAGCTMRSMLLTEKWLTVMADVIDAAEAPVYVASEEVVRVAAGFPVHRGALAAMERPAPTPLAEVLATARRVAVLEDVNDHTNVGAIFRGAAALGIDAVLLSPSCADPLYRRSVKVAMGAVFSVPWARVDPWPGGLQAVREAGLRVLAMTPAPDAVDIGDLDAATRERCALLLGAEGPGLSRRALEAADIAVRIPMSNGVDSLNVGAAAAVAFYAVTQ